MKCGRKSFSFHDLATATRLLFGALDSRQIDGVDSGFVWVRFRATKGRRSSLFRPPLSTFPVREMGNGVRCRVGNQPTPLHSAMKHPSHLALALLTLAGCSLTREPLAPE